MPGWHTIAALQPRIDPRIVAPEPEPKDKADPASWARVDRACAAVFEAAVALRGTLSGEHGIGLIKRPYMHLEQSPRVIALQEQIKSLFDPKHLLNPGKIFPAHVQRLHKAC